MKLHARCILAASTLGTAVLMAAGTTASAHIDVDPGDATPGASGLVSFSFSHGCEGSPTTQLRIAMPESIPSVAPTINANWDVTKVVESLDEPIAGAHGGQISERVTEVVYTARTAVPDGYRDVFVLSLVLPETPGETIYFPVIQTCEAGETAWIEIPAEGQGADDLDHPAPSVTIASP